MFSAILTDLNLIINKYHIANNSIINDTIMLIYSIIAIQSKIDKHQNYMLLLNPEMLHMKFLIKLCVKIHYQNLFNNNSEDKKFLMRQTGIILILIVLLQLCRSTQRSINIKPPSIDKKDLLIVEKCTGINCDSKKITKNEGSASRNIRSSTDNIDQPQFKQGSTTPPNPNQLKNGVHIPHSSPSVPFSKGMPQRHDKGHFNFFFYYGILMMCAGVVMLGIAKLKKCIQGSKQRIENQKKQQQVLFIDNTRTGNMAVSVLDWNNSKIKIRSDSDSLYPSSDTQLQQQKSTDIYLGQKRRRKESRLNANSYGEIKANQKIESISHPSEQRSSNE